MAIGDYISATRVPLSALTRRLRIEDLLFTSITLPFTMQLQTQSNWCWAATATSVSLFYWPVSGWTQCKVANAELDRADCCNSPVPGACNVPWYLDRALTRTRNFVSMTGPAAFHEVRAQLQAGRVVGARIGWSGGGGHFMVIDGCSTVGGTEYFDIDDPIYGQSHITVDTFRTSYQGSGSWTHTYYTKSGFLLMIKPLLLTEPFLRRIWEVRPLLAFKRDPAVDPQALETDAVLAAPHHVYTMGLDAVVEGQAPPREPSALRVTAVKGDEPVELFDLTPDEAAPQIRQVSGATPFLGSLMRAFAQAAELAEQESAEAELRLLQIPGLYIDAVWLHYDDAERDVVIPVREAEGTRAFEPVPLQTFLQQIVEPARSRLEMDETMGS